MLSGYSPKTKSIKRANVKIRTESTNNEKSSVNIGFDSNCLYSPPKSFNQLFIFNSCFDGDSNVKFVQPPKRSAITNQNTMFQQFTFQFGSRKARFMNVDEEKVSVGR